MEKKNLGKLDLENRFHDYKSDLIETEKNTKDLETSYWSENLIREYEGVEFFTPLPSDSFLRLVRSHSSLKKDGSMVIIPPYYRRGVFVKSNGNPDVLITVCYRHIDENKIHELPLGKRLVGKAQIKKSYNEKSKKERIIVNFFYVPKQVANKKILIRSQEAKSDRFQVIIPKTNGKKITVVPLK